MNENTTKENLAVGASLGFLFILGWLGGWYFTEPKEMADKVDYEEYREIVNKSYKAKAELETERQKLACEKVKGLFYEMYTDGNENHDTPVCVTHKGEYFWNGSEFTREESL